MVEETYDLSKKIVGFAGIDIENLGRTNMIETLNPKLEILNKPETQSSNVQNINIGLKG